MNGKFFEIICGVGVIGVCSPSPDDDLIHIIQEDDVIAMGELTEDQFDRYNSKPWRTPISLKRWKPTLKTVINWELIGKE